MTEKLIPIIEGLLFVAQEPLTVEKIRRVMADVDPGMR